MVLALGMALKFYTTAEKALKLKVRKFLGLVPTVVEITGAKLLKEDRRRGLLGSVKSSSVHLNYQG